MPLITLVTDFGLRDPYVGEMKGVLLQIASGLDLVDLTHGIGPGNIREGAWILARSWDLFPAGTCHLGVVDPGVGGERRPIAVSAGGHFFVGPDNGLLSPSIERAGVPEIREITLREIDRARRGTTFDGRDLFAPTAARIASGMPFREVGPELDDLESLPSFAPRATEAGWDVEIVRIDRFGNLVTTAEESFLREEFGDRWRDVSARVGEETVRGVCVAYEQRETGEALLSIGGAGTLEVSVNRGSARQRFDLSAGARILLAAPEED